MVKGSKPEWAKRIEKLREARRETQQQFADHLCVKQPTVWAWEKGDKKRAPSAESFFRLGSLATSRDDRVYFWELGGLDEQAITEAADRILETSRRAPAAGEIIRVRTYRATEEGLRRFGEDVPLPAEFIPNPGSTICLRVENQSSGLDAPRGLYIVDRSIGGEDQLSHLFLKVVVLSFVPSDEVLDPPKGIYIGRIWMQTGAWRHAAGIRLLDRWSLALLTSSVISTPHINLCSEAGELPFAVPSMENSSPYFSITDVRKWVADRPTERGLLEDIERKLHATARLPGNSEVVGAVIGRLTGHLGFEHRSGEV